MPKDCPIGLEECIRELCGEWSELGCAHYEGCEDEDE